MRKRGMNKRGEFYLIAAIIIAISVIGITSLANYTNSPKSPNLDDLKEDLQIETTYLLDYANYNNLDDDEINDLFEDFTRDYINSKSSGKNMYFVFGDGTNFTFMAYQTEFESVTIQTSLGNESLSISEKEIYTDYFSTDNNLTLILDDFEKTFEMKEGENFYFIISSKNNEEKHVVSN